MTMMLLLTVMTPRTPATKEAEEGRGGGFQGEVSLKLGFKDREGRQDQRGERPHAGRGRRGARRSTRRGRKPRSPLCAQHVSDTEKGTRAPDGAAGQAALARSPAAVFQRVRGYSPGDCMRGAGWHTLPQMATRLNFRPHPPDTSILAEMLIAGTGEKLLLKCNSPNRSDCLPVPQVPYRPS